MNRYLKILIGLLLVKAVFIMWAIHSSVIELGPDEAQYWTWSQELDWGYYSKPPGVAWQIRLGTQMLGNTELGVRLASVMISFLTALSVYFLARACRLNAETAFWAGIVMAFSPLGILGSFLATTDGGMILFWTLACVAMARALAKGGAPNYPLLGSLIMMGALFKWTVYLFWVFVFLGMYVYPALRSRRVWVGVTISLLGFLPSVIWNYTHEWATFRHVFTQIKGGDGSVSKGNFFDFLGAQVGLLSPVFFVLLILAFGSLIRHRAKIWPSVLFCGATSLLPLIAFSVAALFQKIQGNWAVFAYPSGIVLLAWFACEKIMKGRGWLLGGAVLSVILTVGILSLPAIQAEGLAPIPYSVNPFKHNLGWKALNGELKKLDYNPKEHFLFGDKYQMSSILSFYGPEQKRAYFLNLQETRQNQFSYWPSMKEGGTGFFVITENASQLPERAQGYRELLSNYFEEVHFEGIRPLFLQNGVLMKGAAIFKCLNYNGKQPNPTKHY